MVSRVAATIWCPLLKRHPFVIPSAPVLKAQPPTGPDWIHEVKFDGFRVQIHKDGDEVTLFSRRGHDITKRFRAVAVAVASLPCHSVVIDAELTACDHEGKPDFVGLLRRQNRELCLWCFDLMKLEGADYRGKPLWERKRELQRLVLDADEHQLRFSDDFDDPMKLLHVAEQWKLEGIVSKKVDQPYKSGKNLGWVKVKTLSWRQTNQTRFELFKKRTPS